MKQRLQLALNNIEWTLRDMQMPVDKGIKLMMYWDTIQEFILSVEDIKKSLTDSALKLSMQGKENTPECIVYKRVIAKLTDAITLTNYKATKEPITSNKFTICTDYCMRDFKRSNGNVDLLKAKSLEMALQDIKRYITYDMRIDEKSETYQVDLHIDIDRLKIKGRPDHAIEFSRC